MSLYLVQFDGGCRYVEAGSFTKAIALWNAAMVDEFGTDGTGWTGTDEPESVSLIHEDVVIRVPDNQVIR